MMVRTFKYLTWLSILCGVVGSLYAVRIVVSQMKSGTEPEVNAGAPTAFWTINEAVTPIYSSRDNVAYEYNGGTGRER